MTGDNMADCGEGGTMACRPLRRCQAGASEHRLGRRKGRPEDHWMSLPHLV